MLILVFAFDVGKYCNEKKKKKRVSDLLVAEKIMGFLEYSFSPLVWLLRKSILGKHFFFYWATEWALKYHGPMRPMELVGPDEGGSRPRKKIRLVNKPGLGRGS